MVASSDMRDLTAFFALLSRIELGRICVEGAVDDRFDAFDRAAGEGGVGLSVPHASQQRNVVGLTRVQMSQVQVFSMGWLSGCWGLGCEGRRVGGEGLVGVRTGGFWPEYLCLESVGEGLLSDLIGIGAPWLPHGFSALGGV